MTNYHPEAGKEWEIKKKVIDGFDKSSDTKCVTTYWSFEPDLQFYFEILLIYPKYSFFFKFNRKLTQRFFFLFRIVFRTCGSCANQQIKQIKLDCENSTPKTDTLTFINPIGVSIIDDVRDAVSGEPDGVGGVLGQVVDVVI